MNTQLITNMNFVELSFFKVHGHKLHYCSHSLIYMSSFAYINSIYFMDSTKTHTAVPEQNYILNIYAYIELFQLKLSQTIVIDVQLNMSAK